MAKPFLPTKYLKIPKILSQQLGLSKRFLRIHFNNGLLTSILLFKGYGKGLEEIEDTERIREYIENIPKATLFYSGTALELLEYGCYVCTHQKNKVKPGGEGYENYLKIEFSLQEFYKYVKKGSKYQSQETVKGLKKLEQEKPFRHIYDKPTKSLIYATPFEVVLNKVPKKRDLRLSGLNSINNQELKDIESITLYVLKNIINEAFDKDGNTWAKGSLHFNHNRKKTISKIRRALKKGGENRYIGFLKRCCFADQILEEFRPKLRKQPKIGITTPENKQVKNKYTNPAIGCNGYHFIHLHDNKDYPSLELDIIDMALFCCPSLLEERVKGKDKKKVLVSISQERTLIYLIREMFLLYCMGINGFLEGGTFIPEGVSCEKIKNGKISLTLNRNFKEISKVFEVTTEDHFSKSLLDDGKSPTLEKDFNKIKKIGTL